VISSGKPDSAIGELRFSGVLTPDLTGSLQDANTKDGCAGGNTKPPY
jgi:hypothetical protein